MGKTRLFFAAVVCFSRNWGKYPLVNKQKTIEHGPVEIVDLPINSMVIFHSCLYVYQRVMGNFPWIFYDISMECMAYSNIFYGIWDIMEYTMVPSGKLT